MRKVPRLWAAALGGEVTYEVDLPACCQRDARSAGEGFQCADCGAAWEPVEEASPEICGFTKEAERQAERRGAA